MITEKTIPEILEKCEVPVKKTPVLVWNKRLNKKEKELLNTINEHQYFYHNLETGRNSFFLKDILSEKDINSENYCLFDKTSKDEYRYYMQFLEDYQVIIIGRASLNCRAIKKSNWNETRSWQRAGEFVVTSDKKCFNYLYEWQYDYDLHRWGYKKTIELTEKLSGYHAPFKIEDMISYGSKSSLIGVNKETYQQLMEIMLNLFPQYCNVGANNMINICQNPYNLVTFLKYKEPAKKEGPRQKQINELSSIDLKPIPYEFDYPNRVAIIQRVKEGMCVLRTTIVDHDNMKMIDCARIYVDKKRVISCRPDNLGRWVSMSLNSNTSNWTFELFDFDKEVVKDTKLQYFGDIVQDIEPKLKGLVIWSFLSLPITEQLVKSGLKELLLKLINSTRRSGRLKEKVEFIFGNLVTNKKAMLETLGINKHQFNSIKSLIIDDGRSFLCDIKLILANKRRSGYYNESVERFIYNLSYLDDKSFDLLVVGLQKAYELSTTENSTYYSSTRYYKLVNSLSLTNELYGLQTTLNMLPILLECFLDKVNVTSNYSYNYGQIRSMNVIDTYYDYLDMVLQLKESTSFKPYFNPKKLDELVSMHDMLINLINLKKDEIEMENFIRLVKKWEKWTYSNEKYSIICPQKASDIAKEGIELHHCVKSYIPRVLNETTNILFIRENYSIDKPFFTIEVSNTSDIEQIHGFANRNVGSEPGLQDFVDEWIKKCKMKKKNWDKVR